MGHGGGMNMGSNQGIETEETYDGEMISVPNDIGDDDNLIGQAGQGESYTSTGGPSLTWKGQQVEYNSVFGQYKEQAISQIENGTYPSGVQDIIKSYFEKLSV